MNRMMNLVAIFRLLAVLVPCMGLTQLHAFDEVSLAPAFGAASFDFPLAVRHAGDGSERRFVVERGGRIRIVTSTDVVLEPPFLDLTAVIDTTGEGGLLGLAFHPQFADNGRFYVNYTYDGNPDGATWLSDVGQSSWEEINLEPAGVAGGRNYGWRICEGNWLRGSTTEPCDLVGHSGPVMEYRTGPDDNCAVTGGYRYRGPVTALAGQYVFGDFCSGRIWFAQPSGDTWEMEEFTVLEGFGNLVGFGEDEAGELYLMRGSGQVLRFEGPRD